MFGNEPDLQLVAADYAADDQIIRAIVAAFSRATCHRACFLQHDLMRVQQPRNLNRYFFAPLRRSWNHRRLGHVVGHGDADAAEELDSLCDGIDQLVLLVMMFVEQQMQLIERRPRHLPVVFLVQVAQCHGVRKELVEIFDALFADALGQGVLPPPRRAR